MIRINLLPVRQTQKRQSVQQQLLIAGAAVIVSVIACVVWTAIVASTAEERKQTVAAKKAELQQLEKIIGEVNAFSEKKKEYEDKLKIIDDLSKAKTGPVKALDDLATEIPNRVWLSNLKEINGSMTIEGLAIDPEDVSSFLKSLEKSKYFSGITLVNSNSTSSGRGSGEITLYNFKITCSVNYSA